MLREEHGGKDEPVCILWKTSARAGGEAVVRDGRAVTGVAAKRGATHSRKSPCWPTMDSRPKTLLWRRRPRGCRAWGKDDQFPSSAPPTLFGFDIEGWPMTHPSNRSLITSAINNFPLNLLSWP